MTITREDLEYAAKAAGMFSGKLDHGSIHADGKFYLHDETGAEVLAWHPGEDDGDCARMEAAVGIDVEWFSDLGYVRLTAWEATTRKFFADYESFYKDHANDKCAARRYASVKLAAAVGRAM